MVEVFKTNVNSPLLAKLLVGLIDGKLPGHRANFDLEDCDRILRVVCDGENIRSARIIELLAGFGCWAEILEDLAPPARWHGCIANPAALAQ